MLDKRWRLGTLLGFPVEVNLTFLLLLGVAFLWLGGLAGVFMIGIAFGSVLLHELGHAVVARKLGVRVSGIELHFFGGAAKMIEMPRSANHEIAIAAAGPIVSLILAGLGLGLGALTGAWLLTLIGWINLIIALFNLLPALPMDGGRILRALLTRRFDFVRATDASVTVARAFAVGFVVLGLAGAYQLLFLAPLLWFLSGQERAMARLMADRFAYDRSGYTARTGGVEVIDRDAAPFGEVRRPFRARRGEPPEPGRPWGRRAPPRAFVVRQIGGRLVIEIH